MGICQWTVSTSKMCSSWKLEKKKKKTKHQVGGLSFWLNASVPIDDDNLLNSWKAKKKKNDDDD